MVQKKKKREWYSKPFHLDFYQEVKLNLNKIINDPAFQENISLFAETIKIIFQCNIEYLIPPLKEDSRLVITILSSKNLDPLIARKKLKTYISRLANMFFNSAIREAAINQELAIFQWTKKIPNLTENLDIPVNQIYLKFIELYNQYNPIFESSKTILVLWEQFLKQIQFLQSGSRQQVKIRFQTIKKD